ncbi:hypothetical protein GGTG_00242 [Gaeumannomyces tritici R3-111a-1]|uniref:Secreted protein n=1 Tax=Gaeumannomyces tritici (strain R3-111a-1) TaxID=644352 RepID=J3NG49_GAET3|nr:hypothetical protein GGTG_00242 [Gaeumannomyces tritici R3-111a-1]EJT80239.1 hypothetical protein GGTG_00242 [Gaeumannomyces tritici R3-111a-1]
MMMSMTTLWALELWSSACKSDYARCSILSRWDDGDKSRKAPEYFSRGKRAPAASTPVHARHSGRRALQRAEEAGKSILHSPQPPSSHSPSIPLGLGWAGLGHGWESRRFRLPQTPRLLVPARACSCLPLRMAQLERTEECNDNRPPD